ncbi:MAG: hypothetical protein ACLTSG_06180 [Lachnospiraceae bacterium]
MLEWIASSCALILAVLLLRRLLLRPDRPRAAIRALAAGTGAAAAAGELRRGAGQRPEPRAGRGREGGVAGRDLCKPNRARPGPL